MVVGVRRFGRWLVWAVVFLILFTLATSALRVAFSALGIDVTAEEQGRPDPKNTVGETVAVVAGAALAIVVARRLHRSAHPGLPPWSRRRRILMCGALLGALAITGAVARAFPVDDEITRDEVVAEARRSGLTLRQAECVADELEAQLGSFDQQAEAADVRTSLQVIFSCAGAAGASDCIVDELVEILDLDAGGSAPTAFVRAVGELDSRDRIALAQAGMVCQGATEATAECVTDEMVHELGIEVFEQPRPVLDARQSAAVEAMVARCDGRLS